MWKPGSNSGGMGSRRTSPYWSAWQSPPERLPNDSETGFKSAATFWREDRIEPLICLRAILKSGRWDAFMLGHLTDRYHVAVAPDGVVPESPVAARLAA